MLSTVDICLKVTSLFGTKNIHQSSVKNTDLFMDIFIKK